MNKYEMLTIYSAALTDEQRDAVIKKYSDLIEKNNGKIVSLNKWGVKKLAYPINYKKEGFYVLVEFQAEGTLPKRINELMNIDEAVMRNMCINKDAE